MATRQRTRSSRKTGSTQTTSGEQLAEDSTQRRVEESQVLRSSFDTTSLDGEGRAAETEGTDAPKATFVGEQLIYKERYERIAEAAYHRAEKRGFAPGNELDDWLAAEREVDGLLESERPSNA